MSEGGSLHYRRSKFAARLKRDLLYTESHFWLERQEGDLWRVGFTLFAIRMLGEPVEIDFEVEAGATIATGDVVGWLEGFKAVTDLFAPMAGEFAGPNPGLQEAIQTVKTDPYRRGWLYAVRGVPGKDCVDAEGYAAFLDTTIDRMMGSAE